MILTAKLAIKGKRFSSEELYRLKIDLAKRLLTRKISKQKIAKVMHFLKFYIRLGNEQLDQEFNKEISKAINPNPLPMTIEEAVLCIVKEEGIEQGHLERNTTFVQNLLRETKFTQREIAKLAGVTVGFVREVKRKLQ